MPTRRAGSWFVALGCTWAFAGEPTPQERGRRLFDGELPMTARIAGNASPLPAHAARCVNCHAAGRQAAKAPSGSASSVSFGPRLDAAMLTRNLPRRGGPPSRYDEASFCRLLADGTDPAYVLIPRSMPRYDLSAADCRALWTHLTRTRR